MDLASSLAGVSARMGARPVTPGLSDMPVYSSSVSFYVRSLIRWL